MRDSINGVADLEALVLECEAAIGGLLEAANLSGDPKGYVVKQIQAMEENGVSVYPFTNDEVAEIYDRVVAVE